MLNLATPVMELVRIASVACNPSMMIPRIPFCGVMLSMFRVPLRRHMGARTPHLDAADDDSICQPPSTTLNWMPAILRH